jgi:hypothetical protein
MGRKAGLSTRVCTVCDSNLANGLARENSAKAAFLIGLQVCKYMQCVPTSGQILDVQSDAGCKYQGIWHR